MGAEKVQGRTVSSQTEVFGLAEGVGWGPCGGTPSTSDASRGWRPGRVIVADTGAVVALVDAGDGHHAVLRALFEEDPYAWVLPWAMLPEVDYLLGAHVGREARRVFQVDTVVMATAERLNAEAVATLDLGHFGAVDLAGGPLLLPRDL